MVCTWNCFISTIWVASINKFFFCKNHVVQAKNIHILKLFEKIAAFRRKLRWIKKIIENGNRNCFPQLRKYAVFNEVAILQDSMPFSRNTFQSSLNGVQHTLQKTQSKNSPGHKILSMLKLHQDSLRKKNSLNSLATAGLKQTCVLIYVKQNF